MVQSLRLENIRDLPSAALFLFCRKALAKKIMIVKSAKNVGLLMVVLRRNSFKRIVQIKLLNEMSKILLDLNLLAVLQYKVVINALLCTYLHVDV